MKDKKLTWNLIYSIFYQVLLIITPILTAPYIARVLGAANTGIYSYTYSVAHYFVLFAMLGLANYGTRTIAMVSKSKEDRSKTFWEIYSMQLATAFLSSVVYIIYLFVSDVDNKPIALIQGLYVASAIFDISWFYQGIAEFKTTVTRSVVVKVVTIILIFVFVRAKEDLWKYSLIMCGGMLGSQIALWIPLNNYISFSRPSISRIKRHIKPNLLLFSSVIAVSVYKIMSKILLGIFSDYEQVGFYENAEKITNLPMGIVAAVGTVMLSKMSSIASNNNEDSAVQTIGLTLKPMMAFSIGISFGLYAVGEEFAVFFFGQEFALTGVLLKYLGLVTVFLSWGNVIRTQYLMPKKEDKLVTKSVFIGAGINLVLNFILLRFLGALGAVLSTLATEFVVAAIVTYYARKGLPIKKYLCDSAPYILYGVVMLAVIKLIDKYVNLNLITELFIKIVTGALIYCALVLVHWYRQYKGKILNQNKE